MRRRSMQYSQGAVSSVSMRRNKFDLSHGVKTSLSVGTLVPIDVQEVLPGDTFVSHETHVARLTSAFLRPVMDNVWLDVYEFFVPYRLLYNDSEQVFGNAEPSEYIDNDLAEFPTLPKSQVVSGSIADYMGLPVTPQGKVIPAGVNVLPFRAFALIYNEWFRNENVQQSTFVQKGEYVDSEALNGNEWSQSNYTGMPPKITRKKDLFTACLPAPQKGEPVSLELVGQVTPAPVKTVDGDVVGGGQTPMKMISLGDSTSVQYYNLVLGARDGLSRPVQSVNLTASTPSGGFYPSNLVADLSNLDFRSINVNDLRFAFQAQKMLEKDARYGSRYREYILGHFGVTNADARMQVPEFLGGHRTPLNVSSVAQTSAQDGSGTPLATLGGLSHSVGMSRYVKSFTEHGYVITVAAIRQLHTYQQGIEKMWFRKERNDFYDPLFANLGEQPIYAQQLYGLQDNIDPTVLGDGNVFGYNEYGAEYRYRPSYITGQVRTGVENSLDIYHFGDYYANEPTLSPQFINETPDYFDRTVAVPSTSQDNFILDFWFDVKAVRVMPLYSTPGLIDHH